MRNKKEISARGVYYVLENSPYVYTDDYGVEYHFSSFKKMQMFEIRVKEKLIAFDNEIEKLRALGYSINKKYETNKKDLPSKVYNDMLYK